MNDALRHAFETMARDGMRPSSLSVLHPAERCLLSQTGAAAATGMSDAACAAAAAAVAAYMNETSEGRAWETCWLRPLAVNDTRRRCKPSEGHVTSLKRFANPNAAIGPARLLSALRRWPIAIAGDSLMRFVYDAAQCEVLRSAASSLDKRAMLSRLAFVDLNVDATKQRASISSHLSRLSRLGGGVFIASLGAHYNVEPANHRGAVEAFDIHDRSDYDNHVTQLAALLEEYATTKPSPASNAPSGTHVAILATPPLQHFETRDGTYARSIYASTGYGCRELDEAAREHLESTSANSWRSADMIAIARKHAPHVLVAPWHAVSRHLWDQHPGNHGTRRAERKHYLFKRTLDCTHFCYSPFVYEPLWWAIGEAARVEVEPPRGPFGASAAVDVPTWTEQLDATLEVSDQQDDEDAIDVAVDEVEIVNEDTHVL